jgi:hypothetical protein
MRTIEINGTPYTLRLGLRALALYEEASGKHFTDCKGLIETAQMFYCVVAAYNEEFSMTFEEFMELIEDMRHITEFSKWLAAEWAKQAQLSAEDDKSKGTKGDEKKKWGLRRWFKRWPLPVGLVWRK